MSSYVQYTGNGSTQTYSVTFPYLSQAHVAVTVNNIVQLSPADFEWLTAASIRFRVAPSGTITIRRITERDTALVDFQNGSVLTEEELNTAILQNFYITQELQDALDGYINGGVAFYTSGSLVGSTVQDRIDAAAAEILDSALLADLQSRIVDIDGNAESIIATNATLSGIQDQVDALATIDGVGIGTLITNEENARIAGDTALVNTVALIGAKSGDNTAFIVDLNTTRVGPTESLATRLSALSAADGANSAAIVTEQSTRASADSAISGSVSTLQSVVNGNSAAISTTQSVVNGVIAQYMVKLDVNGHVAGFGLYNSAGSSSFIVNASKFAVTDGSSSKIPFLVSGGVCYMQNVVIQDALIANLTVGKLTTGTLTAAVTQNADWSIGTGRIIADNGSRKRVMGVGFGVGSAFADWYGPSATAIGSISATGAVFYIKTDGTAYFNGVLGPAATGSIPAPAAFSASNSTDDASYSGGNFGLQSGTVTVTPSGGTSPYKYRWTVVPRPGYTLNIFCNSPSSASTTFGSTGTNTEGEIGAYCTVTDANGRVAVTNVVTIHATHGTPP